MRTLYATGLQIRDTFLLVPLVLLEVAVEVDYLGRDGEDGGVGRGFAVELRPDVVGFVEKAVADEVVSAPALPHQLQAALTKDIGEGGWA